MDDNYARGRSSPPPRPKLAVVYQPDAIGAMEIAEAARAECDLVWVMDQTDPALQAVIPLIRRLGTVVDTAGLGLTDIADLVAEQRPSGVITFASQMPVAAAIAARIGSRFHSRQTAGLLTNKYRQRLALNDAGVRGPEFWAVSAVADRDERAQLVAGLTYPVVLKPQDGIGSRQTYLVPDAPMLADLLEEARLAADDMLVEDVLVEAHPRDAQRFGEVLMVDSFVADGHITHLVVAGHFIPAPPFRGTGSFVPTHLTDVETKAVLLETEAAMRALGIANGFVNTDLILTPDGPRVLEVNGRIGGEIPALLQMAGARPLVPEAIKFAIGNPEVDVTPLRTDVVAFCAMYQPPMEARRLVELKGLDAVARLPGVTGISHNLCVGDEVDWRKGTISRLFTVYGVANDHDQMYEIHQQIERTVVVRYS